MKKTILLLSLLLSFVMQSQTYIDFSASTNGIGTKASPLNNYPTSTIVNGIYLFKKGTTLTTANSFRISTNNVTVDVYGTGARPKIIYTGTGKAFDCGSISNFKIDSIELINGTQATTLLHFITGGPVTISNCLLHGIDTGRWVTWAIRDIQSTGWLKIINTKIWYTGNDGVFTQFLDSVETDHIYIHDVNRLYSRSTNQSVSGGDGFQMSVVKYFYIHDSKFDHDSTGNKFCVISENSDATTPTTSTGLFLRDTFTRTNEGTGVYLYSDQIGIKFQNCVFQNMSWGVQSEATNLTFTNNIFSNISDRCLEGLGNGGNTSFTNCDFLNVNKIIAEDYNENVSFVNNIVSNCTGTAFQVTKLTNSYNDFYKVSTLGATAGTGCINADPLFNADFSLKMGSPCLKTGLNGVDMGAISSSVIIYPTAQINAVISPSNATNQVLNWTSSNPAIATVDQTGKVTGLTTGITYIKVISTDGTNLKDSALITVVKPVIKMQTLSISNKNINLTLQQ